MSRTGFRLLDPVKSLRQQARLHPASLHDREALLPRERQRRFLMGEGWVAWPGPALADFMRQFIAHNRMLQGGFVIERPHGDPRRHRPCPILTVVGEVDEIAPAPAVRAIAPRGAARRRSTSSRCAPGTSGSSSARTATQTTWPAVAAWTRWRAGDGELPAGVRRVDADEPEPEAPGVGTRLGFGLELAAGVGGGLARSLAGAASRTIGGARVLAEEVDRPAAAPGAAGPARAAHAGLARPAARRAGAPGAGGRVLPVRGPRLLARGGQAPDRQRRPRPALARRPPGRARRRADEHPAERALGGRGAQPARRGRGADAARRRRRSARPSSAA